MTSIQLQHKYKDAADLIGTIRLYRNMLVNSTDEQRESITAALVLCRDELRDLESELFEEFKLKNKKHEN